MRSGFYIRVENILKGLNELHPMLKKQYKMKVNGVKFNAEIDNIKLCIVYARQDIRKHTGAHYKACMWIQIYLISSL